MTNKQILKEHILYLRNQYRNEADPVVRMRLGASHARLMAAYREIFGHTLD